MQTQGDRPNDISSGYSKELNVQIVSYFMVISSCSEKTYSLICFGNWKALTEDFSSFLIALMKFSCSM